MSTSHQDTDAQAAIAPSRGRLILRQIGPWSVAALVVFLLRDRVMALDVGRVIDCVLAVSAGDWAMAVLATGISFWAIGRYDGVLHGIIGTGVCTRAARITGATAIALSQTLGFGVVTGSLVRWRLLPSLGAAGAAQLTILVTASFLAGWLVVTGLTLLILPSGEPVYQYAGIAAVGLCFGAMALSIWPPRLSFRGRALRLPSLRAMAVIVAFACLDTLAAAFGLYCLMPADVSYQVLLPAFLLAFGAGLISGTPGGVGPFEVTLLALLSQFDSEPLLAGIVAWRVVYYALPAALAGLVWLSGPIKQWRAYPKTVAPAKLNPADRHAIATTKRAEAALIYQGRKELLKAPCGNPAFVSARLGQSLIALGDPVGDCPDTALDALRVRAANSHTAPCVYKCSARTAARARRRGFTVIPVAQEALIDLADFTLDTPARSGLRRKLRKADKAGVTVRAGAPDAATMADLHRQWATRNKGERGFSMGTFDTDYIDQQAVFTAFVGDTPVAFATFHRGVSEYTLDLMRTGDDAPDGTMYALVTAGIAAARAAGCARLSLAAVPYEGEITDPRLSKLQTYARRTAPGAGLRQFKAAFAPRWEMLYVAASSPLALSVAGAEIIREILRPAA